MAERKMHDTENGRMENARHGKWQKIHTLENGRKYTPGKWQNGKCTTRKMTENSHTGKWQKIHTWKMTERKMHDTEFLIFFRPPAFKCEDPDSFTLL